jgi:adenylate cyclase
MKAGDLRPDDYQTYILAGTKFIQMGDERGKPLLEEGVARVRQRLLYDPQDSRALCLAAGALVVLNQTDEARRLAERAYEIDRFSTTLYNLACFYSLVGDKERAIQMLQEAYEGGLRNANWIHTDAEIDPIRDDPRVQEIISKMESDVTPRPG